MTDPTHIGRYAIDAQLGQGAMGVIYRAHDPAIDRTVAIKLIRADILDAETRPEYVQRFEREARAAGRCVHPNIVLVFDVATHDGNPYIVMEFVDGITLAQLLRARGPLPAPEAVAIAAQILDGLAAAHAQGVVHRDVKPANVMLTRDGRVKVADFGISRLGAADLTQPGALVGTPSTMSPEQLKGGPIDARSDLFATGTVLFELLTGQRPFPGTSAHEVWSRLMNDPPQDLAALQPGLPPALVAAVNRSLAKSPHDRFPDAPAMAAALRAPAPAPVAWDQTVVAPLRPQPASLDPAIVTTLERHLAAHVGPIARRLVEQAAARADTIDALCESLASSIDLPGNRQRFMADARASLGTASSTSLTAPSAIPAATVDAITRALARHMGPIAPALVRRAAPAARDARDLCQRLSAHIDDPQARATFLTQAMAP